MLSERRFIGSLLQENKSDYCNGITVRRRVAAGDFCVPVCYDWDPDIKLLFKAVNLQVDEEGLSLVERMVEYMKLCTELIGSALFIFNQFRAYLDDAQLEEFYRTILDEKIPVMLMEGREYDKIKGESWFIIDKDLCQIF